MSACLLSIVVPCYNEREIVEDSIHHIQQYATAITEDYQIVIVDDGSTDGSSAVCRRLAAENSRICHVKFTRNFGKEAAVYAGLTKATGSAIVIMDADLQHPPTLLSTLFKYWREEGYEVVEAVKSNNSNSGKLSHVRSSLFNWLMSRLTGLNMSGASDYKLMDRRVVQILLEMPERNRFFRGLVNWTGFRAKQVIFDVHERSGGKTKWSFWSLLRLSVLATTSFSNIPLQIITILGMITLAFSVLLGVQTLYNKFYGGAVSGFTTVILLNLMLNSIIMISLGIIGSYLANIYTETKKRPFYIISEDSSDPHLKKHHEE